MAWIPMIPEDEAEGELKEWYDELRDPWGGVDDIMRMAVLGGWIYLIFRVAHFICFTLSVPYMRTASWFASIFGIVIIGWSVFRLAAV